MSIIISVIILILSMLISFFMQLTPGTFALFYHYALGKTTAKKADDRSLSFILGVEIFTVVIWLLIYSLVLLFFYHFPHSTNIFFCVASAIFLIEALFAFFFYYRKGKSTALFISRHVATSILSHIKKLKNRSDCIILGAFIGFFELIFTLPLYIISASIFVNFNFLPHVTIIIIYIILSILPLFLIRSAFRFGHNLADIQRFRAKIKLPVRLVFLISFILLSLATIYLGVFYHG